MIFMGTAREARESATAIVRAVNAGCVGAKPQPFRGVVHLSLGWASLPSLVRNMFVRRESWFMRSRFSSRMGIRVTALFGLKEIDLNLLPELSIGKGSVGGPMDRAIDRIDALGLHLTLSRFARQFPDSEAAASILRNSILRAVSERAVDAFYAQAWAESLGYEKVVFVGASVWDKALLEDRANGRRVTGVISRNLAMLGDAVCRA